MKGKGKGDKDKGDQSECPLHFPELKPVEHTRVCPRYTTVLSREDDEGIGVEELDSLQTELENLLASAAKRMLLLQEEIEALNSWQDKGKDRRSIGKPGPESSPGKRSGKGGDDKPSKKFKESSGKGSSTPKPKGKVQHLKVPETNFELPESPNSRPPPEIPKVPRNDTPNRFWTMVEPYCADITTEDLKVLEDLMRAHEDEHEYHKIPGLGKHFSQKWAQEDLLEEQREGSKVSEKRRSLNSSGGSNAGDTVSLLKRNDDSSPFGPLTQRLVQALIEENIMTPIDDGISEADAAEAASISPRSLAKQLNIGSTATLERRIRRELEENGILDVDDRSSDEGPEDEILTELKRKQQELKVLSQHNLMLTKRLYKMAKDQMQRQELRKKMAVADAEVMEAYRKIQAAKQKKKTPTKKEREAALKSIKDRESLVKQLESMG